MHPDVKGQHFMKGFVLGVALAVRPRKQVSGQKPKQKVTKTRRTAFEPQHCFENKTKHTKTPKPTCPEKSSAGMLRKRGAGRSPRGLLWLRKRLCPPCSITPPGTMSELQPRGQGGFIPSAPAWKIYKLKTLEMYLLATNIIAV